MAYVAKLLTNTSSAALETAINAYLTPLTPVTIDVEYSSTFIGYTLGSPTSGTPVIEYSALITTS